MQQSNAHHEVDRLHVSKLLLRRSVVFFGAFCEHVAHFDRVLVAVVQDAGCNFAISSRPSRLLPSKLRLGLGFRVGLGLRVYTERKTFL